MRLYVLMRIYLLDGVEKSGLLSEVTGEIQHTLEAHLVRKEDVFIIRRYNPKMWHIRGLGGTRLCLETTTLLQLPEAQYLAILQEPIGQYRQLLRGFSNVELAWIGFSMDSPRDYP